MTTSLHKSNAIRQEIRLNFKLFHDICCCVVAVSAVTGEFLAKQPHTANSASGGAPLKWLNGRLVAALPWDKIAVHPW